jgi:hypothetical protein
VSERTVSPVMGIPCPLVECLDFGLVASCQFTVVFGMSSCDDRIKTRVSRGGFKRIVAASCVAALFLLGP